MMDRWGKGKSTVMKIYSAFEMDILNMGNITCWRQAGLFLTTESL